MIDAHHHLWDPSQARYPWLEREQAAPLRRRFDVAELRAAAAGQDLEATVVIEARESLDETRSLLRIAATSDLVAGVVGWVDLTDPGIVEVLDELRAGPGGERLAGVRVELEEHEPDWIARADVAGGLRALAAAGLAYDVIAGPRELHAVLRAARAVPELTMVVDHLGKPDVAGGPGERWTVPMAALGALPNVWCKVSGGFREAFGDGARREALVPFVSSVREWFGDGRLVFGSDWPVSTLAAPYGDMVAGWRALLADLRPDDREATFGGNARRIYQLP